MIQYIEIFFKFLFGILNFFAFTYLYYPLYIKCNVQKRIKKGNKNKIVCKPRCTNAFIYFLLLFLIFYSFTFKVFLFLFFGLILIGLICYDKFVPNFNGLFNTYDKMPWIILLWKIFDTIFTLVYMCTSPINKYFNEIIKRKLSGLKKIFSLIANMNTNSFEEKDISEINRRLGLKNDDEISKMSGISEYIVNSSKSEKKLVKSLKNEKKIKNSKKSKKIKSLIKEKKLNTIIENNISNTHVENNENSENNEDNVNNLNNEDNKNEENNKSFLSDNTVTNINECVELNNPNINLKSSTNSTSSKEEVIEKANNINNIFSNNNTNEIDDITFTINSIDN